MHSKQPTKSVRPAYEKCKYILKALLAIVTFVSVISLSAQENHTTPFTGTWKLNKAKSKFSPGSAPKSVTITNALDGFFTATSVDAQDRQVTWSHPWSDGKEVPINGMENATMLSKIRGNTLNETMRIAGVIAETVHVVVSPDGRTMTTTIHALANHPMGSMHGVLVLEKQ